MTLAFEINVLVDQDPGLTGNLLVERLVTTSEEINFVKEIAATTGIVLDPVYRKVLFMHTGWLFGLDDKVEQMAPL
ncbi:hypothetical protein FF1_039516 [Malus domestica]